MNARTLPLVGLVGATLLIAVAYAISFMVGGPTRIGAWLIAIAVPTALVAMILLGTSARRRASRLALPLFLLWALLLGCFTLALALPATEGPGSRLWLGLPLRAALILYGVGLVPLLVLPIAHGITFDEGTSAGEGEDLPGTDDAAPVYWAAQDQAADSAGEVGS